MSWYFPKTGNRRTCTLSDAKYRAAMAGKPRSCRDFFEGELNMRFSLLVFLFALGLFAASTGSPAETDTPGLSQAPESASRLSAS